MKVTLFFGHERGLNKGQGRAMAALMRNLRLFGPVVVAGLLASAMVVKAAQPDGSTRQPAIVYETIPLNDQDPDQQRIGPLIYRGGLVLRADAERFGGYSGLAVRDGTRFWALSDRGTWLTGRLIEQGGRLTGVEDVQIEPVRGIAGRPVPSYYDTEGVALDGDDILVSTEGEPRLSRYAGADLSRATALPVPGDLEKEMSGNGGWEAIAVLADGQILAVSEKAQWEPGLDLPEGAHKAWLIAGGQAQPLGIRVPEEHAPTALAKLPDGDYLMLLRFFSPFRGLSIKLARVPAAALKPGGEVQVQELVTLRPPLSVDNMEGLAVRQVQGRTRIYLISDDNQNPVQRTLLLAFELVDAETRKSVQSD